MKRPAVMMVAVMVGCVACASVFAQDTNDAGPMRNLEHEKHLQPLKWFIGDWEIKGQLLFADQAPQDFVFQKSSEWTLGNSFLETTTTETTNGVTRVVHKSMIGWDPEHREIKEWGFWFTGGHEVVAWSPESENWLITREGLKGKYTVLGTDKHRYEAEFMGDDGKMHRWHFTAERK
jgi:hypothetical protein